MGLLSGSPLFFARLPLHLTAKGWLKPTRARLLMKKLLALVLALVMALGLATVGANAALKDYSDADSISDDYS